MAYRKIHPELFRNESCVMRLWAPEASQISLVTYPEGKGSSPQETMLEKMEGGYWEKRYTKLAAGTRYRYRIDEGEAFPDPASLSQPDGVHEPSEIISLEFGWTDQEWKNVPLSEMIQYEIHTGTFSAEGNFDGIRARLDYLLELGINAIELMPVAQFSGKRNWGYDGVYPYAVHHSYGGAKGLMSLVNECHAKGIAVILDVVYNHFGPEGNYVEQFAPYFSGKYSTPWGKSVNYDGPHSDGVRNYVIQNAMMWCCDFHIDALRLDAVHAIYDFGARHILQELAENLNILEDKTGKKHYLIAESNLNDIRHISPVSTGGYGLDAQWSDDFHHSVHTLVTGENNGYYMDFGEPEQLVKAVKSAFVYDGTYSAYRKKSYGSSTEGIPANRFVIFTQNHDQVGNRKMGERLISVAGFEMAKLVAGTMFLAPNIPMLFMGEEYGERNPFLYFVSHLDPELNRLVTEGRQEEFRDFVDEREAPYPAAEATFNQSRLAWDYENNPEQKAMIAYYRKLIGLRKEHPVMGVSDNDNLSLYNNNLMFVLERWTGKHRILAYLNFSGDNLPVSVPPGISGKLKKLLVSTADEWGGPGDVSPGTVTANDQFAVIKQSMVIYESQSS